MNLFQQADITELGYILSSKKLGVVIENVFLGQVDSYGQLTIDIYNDKLQMPSPQNKPLLLASLKKCHADLELFSLETKSKSASEMYSKKRETNRKDFK